MKEIYEMTETEMEIHICKMVSISVEFYRRAKKVFKAVPEVFEYVKMGTMDIDMAEKYLFEKKKGRADCIETWIKKNGGNQMFLF